MTKKSPQVEHKDGLTAKERRFAFEYAADGNAADACRRAGIRGKRLDQKGYQLLRKSEVQRAVHNAQAELRKRLSEQEEAHLVRRTTLALQAQVLAFSNILDYVTIGPDGLPRPDFARITREQASAISEVTVDTYMMGRGDDAREVTRVKLKLADKLGAMNTLARLLGYYLDRVEVRHSWYEALKQLDVDEHRDTEPMRLADRASEVAHDVM